MQIIKPSVIEIEQEPTLNGLYKAIEVAGRTCYKSEDKICEGSAEKLIENFKLRKHGSPMEFGTVYLVIPEYNVRDEQGKLLEDQVLKLKHNKYSKCNTEEVELTEGDFKGEKLNVDFITTNYRVIFENNLFDVFEKYAVDKPSNEHEKRRFFKIICDRALLAEVTRHRVFSFCVESQRYCNYSKDQFCNEITFIEPCWCYGKDDDSAAYMDFAIWKKACKDAEQQYFALLNEGWRPEQARTVLPNSTKTEICMCGFESDWDHFLELRLSERAHPQAREIAEQIKELMTKNKC